MQCVESCRSEGYSYAIENIVDKECHCSKVLDSNLVKLSPHSCNDDRKYRVTLGSVISNCTLCSL